MNRFAVGLVAILMLVGLAVAKRSQSPGDYGTQAAEFPPGIFSDNNHYTLEDLKGKAVVLFFYENSCPRCRGMVPERNKMVASYKDRPVKFIGIGPHDSLAEVRAYIG